MRQILFNLLSNAIKFTRAGRVTLSVSCRARSLSAAESPDPSGTQEWVAVVEDTGIGMDEATVAGLFQRFSQGDASRVREFGGTGLGLEISRSLAQLMGGEIRVSSQVGQGSRFELTLPLTEASEPEPPVDADATSVQASSSEVEGALEPVVVDLTGLRVLVAEDNEVNRLVMDIAMQGMGLRPTFAVDGQEVVEQASQADWDVILMDLHMPKLDGFEATRAIRRLAHPDRAQVTIVALTADVFPETRAACEQAGLKEFLTKPLVPEALEALLRRQVNKA